MLEMTLNDIEKEYLEAKDKKSQIGILADLNGVESTFMALLLREMGNDVDSAKLPRQPRNGGADGYELFQLTPEYAEAVKFRTERGREIGRAVGWNSKEVKKVTERGAKPVEPAAEKEPENKRDGLRMAIYMWGAYMEYRYGQTATKKDMEMLEKLIEMTSKK